MSKSMKGQELSKLPVGTPILYNVNPDSSKIKHPTWLKGTVKNRLGERKYEILTDSDRVITRSRRHLKGYRTRSGRISKAPERFGNIIGTFNNTWKLYFCLLKTIFLIFNFANM